MISVAAPSNANCVLPPRRSRGGAALSRGHCLVKEALPCQGGTAFLALRSNPRFFFWLYRNFFLFFTIFLQFLFYYGILPCLTEYNTVIISIFLHPFPIIYNFYGKIAFRNKLFTVILFARLPHTCFKSNLSARFLSFWLLFLLTQQQKGSLF